ncbi:MAG: DUF2079 domain-containing protein [Ruminiclostridium sp.]
MNKFLTRFRASEHGSEYLMRFISAWLYSLVLILPFRPTIANTVFDKEYAGKASYLLLIIFFAVFYGLLTELRFIPWLKKLKTDSTALLISVAIFTVIYAVRMFREKGTNIDFFLGVVLFIALAVWYTVGKYRISLPKIMKKCWIAVIVLSAVFMLVFTALAMAMRYYKLCTPAFDFGIFTQMFENMKDGLGPITTVERNYELSHFAVHFSPAYYLMLPFYMLFPHPVTLQVLQGVFITSGIIPVFLIARKYGFSLIHSSLFSVIYALYPAFTGGCSYDIHENCMLPAFLLWLIWATEREKTIPMFVFALLTLLVKEDAAVYVAVIGLYLLLSDRSKKTRTLGVAIFGVACVYFFAVCTYLNNNGLGIMDWRYKDYMYSGGALITSIVVTAFTNPGYILSNLFTGEKLTFTVQTLGVLGGIPLVSKKLARYILLIPFVLVNLMPTYQYQHSIYFQYVFGSCALIIWLFIMNISELSYNRARCFTVFSLIACAVMFASTLTGMMGNLHDNNATMNNAIISYLEQLPDNENESITANTFFVPSLYKQKELYTINDRDDPNDKSAPLADIVLLDRTNARFETNYNYFTSLGMREVTIEDAKVAGRVCRLEL